MNKHDNLTRELAELERAFYPSHDPYNPESDVKGDDAIRAIGDAIAAVMRFLLEEQQDEESR